MSEVLASETMLDWALRYIRLGWPVFPLASKGKLPMITGGRGCLDATLNEGQAREWWAKWPLANVGVATGIRFIVLDEDPAKGGTESRDHLVNAHGRFPDTIQQVTGSAGVHYLFAQPDFPVRNSKDYIGPGLDIRGHHGYIVAAPSIHPVTGKAYFWDGGEEIEQQKIAPAPEWLLDRLRKHANRQPEPGVKSAAPLANQIPQGNRHNALVSMAGTMRRRGMSGDEIFAAISVANEQRCQPPYPSDHVRKIADSVAQYPIDARYSVFKLAEQVKADLEGATPDPQVGDGDKNSPITPADVEAAVDAAMAENNLVTVARLVRDIAALRPQDRVVMLVKLRQHFGKQFPEADFKAALKDAVADRPVAPVIDISGHRPGPDADSGAEPADGNGVPLLTWQPLTDAGNGERIVALFGRDVRYCIEMKKWLVWDGKRWAIDELNVMRQKGKQMARVLYSQAVGHPTLEKHARASESYAAISAALGSAATERGIPISATELDQQPFLLNCPNGVVNLRDGKLLDHNRDFLITKLCRVNYEPRAKCPRFQDFLYWAMGAINPDAELTEQTLRLVGFLQRAFGYSLTADVSEKAVFILFGEGGNNGKTTLLTVYRDLLGKDYSGQLVIDTVMSTKNQDATQRADLADLRGVRFVVTSEVEKEHRLNAAKIKYITAGMGSIKSCRKYENPIEFIATHKLLMDCNYRPVVRDVDDAIWRRLKLIPFGVTIPDDQKDVQLPEKLRSELPGILAWTVRGCLAWIQSGLGDPPEVSQAGFDWREHDDPLKEFIEDCCEIGAGLFVKASDLAHGYEWWAKQNREKYPLGREAFNERLHSKKFTQSRGRRINEKQARCWEGIELKLDVVAAIRQQKSGPQSSWQSEE
jgi:P4 family phage/plasmid primase-like protien